MLTPICIRILKNPILGAETASDVVMDFLLEGVHKVQHTHALKPYIRMMAVRRCVRVRQWRMRMEEPSDRTDGTHPEQALLAHEQEHAMLRALHHCLDKLTPKVREILRLRFEKDLTQEAIGRTLGVTKQYLGRFLNQALKELRVCVEAHQ